MAVGKCKECGGQVASSAKACPHCGAKVPKKVGVLGWVFVLFVVLPIAWNIGSGSSSPDKQASSSSARSNSAAPAASSAAPAPRWIERSYINEMTDAVTTALSLKSNNSSVFEFPYRVRGGSFLHLTFRKRGSDLDALFRIDKGQMLCGVIECKFSLRVGDGPVQSWTGRRSSTHERDIMFIRDARQLEQIVKRGERLRVGIEFYQAGTHVFEFDVKDYPGFN